MNEITQQVWGFTPETATGAAQGGGEPVILYTMTNANGATVQLTNYGAAIVGITVPDRWGKMADVVLGYGKWQSYIADGPAMGKSVGRYANRIAKGTFDLDGHTYRLAVNNGPNHLHGGPTGFANRLWEGRVEGDRVVFGYRSADGEEGYPGALYVEACYDWDDDNTLEITYYGRLLDDDGATAAAGATILNLTNHVYFNLNGHDAGSVLGHALTLKASRYLPTDETAIPLAAPQSPASVEGTPMDFRTAHTLGERIEDASFQQLVWGKGYDHCWAIDGYDHATLLPAAELYSEESGRFVKVSTTQPGIQIYTGNWLSGCPESKTPGFHYQDRYGVAMECQAFPNSPNRGDFPGVVLRPGETYEQHIAYEFGTR
ncbi:aldose epimerase family protein [uncultured Rikenella sp.]|uniref:aldose epimerase family protein n=1 Tax=uncultured Rikenella sp. TaxID=368003 RepID=UPI00261CC73C|nr:aldose epimerase family protein [uncultured Rikenella sp.]